MRSRILGRNKTTFLVMWLFVVFSSVHDGYLVLANRYVMYIVEQNPMGRWLLGPNDHNVWPLLAFKACGTVCAASFLLVLYAHCPRIGWPACAALALFQFGLLMYVY